ncbi:MAG: ferritin-like domain-containing protein [Ignavibacteriales bacterium]|jgi:ferritin-like metal-binding protein YciE
MKLESLHDLYIKELRDLYDAEKQIIKALPKMIKAATSSELQSALQSHLEQTRGHAERLEQVFEKLGSRARATKCKGIEGIINEGKEMTEEDGDSAVLDAAIISAAQRVEHYEMAGYGCVRTYAQTLGYEDQARLLEQTLEEEKEADEKLTQIAEGIVNPAAMQSRSDEEYEEEEGRGFFQSD